MSDDNTQNFNNIINNFENLYKDLFTKKYINDKDMDLMVTALIVMKNQKARIDHLERERERENKNLEHRIQQALNISKDSPKF